MIFQCLFQSKPFCDSVSVWITTGNVTGAEILIIIYSELRSQGTPAFQLLKENTRNIGQKREDWKSLLGSLCHA